MTPVSAEYITKVDIKLPEFWTKDPDLWYLHAESTCCNTKITQFQTKFDHVMQKLPKQIMISVRSLIINSFLSATPFEDLKTKLESSKTFTPRQRVSKVIHHPALEDRRPSYCSNGLPEDERLLGSPRIQKIQVRWRYMQISYGMQGELNLQILC